MAKTLNMIADLVLINQTDYAMETYKEFADIAMLMNSTIEDIKEEIENILEVYKNINTTKEFATIAERYECQYFLFQIKKGAVKNPAEINKCLTAKTLINETKRRHTTTFNSLYNKILERKN